ncbi:MAG: hypothetical protein IH855_09870 [Bacteroidetes bacterium]|nr:hypothetical protein [Bacteroidota bacterium]
MLQLRTRAPEDLYALVVDRVRLLRSERDQVAANLEEAESNAERPQGDSDSDVEQVISRLSGLREKITTVAPEVAREALQACIERVDLSFEPGKRKGSHTRFLRGTVTVSRESLMIRQASLRRKFPGCTRG